jgi:hypothetical protein
MMAKVESVRIRKDWQEHETYFDAFVNRQPVRWTVEDMFGNAQEVEVEFTRVEHAGDSTIFTYEVYKRLEN